MAKQHPKPRSLRAQAFEETNYPEVAGTRCVQVLIPDAAEFAAQLAGMIALATKQFNYQNKDPAHAKIITEQWRHAYILNDWKECCCDMNCEELTECLQPFFDLLGEQIAALQATSDAIQATNDALSESQKIKVPEPINIEGCDLQALYGGAKALLGILDAEVRFIMARTETEAPDTLAEGIALVGGEGALLAKQTEGVGVAAGASLVEYYFENQVAAYEAGWDAADFQNDAICLLVCAVNDNACELTYDMAAAWLQSLRDEFPDNSAAEIFARYGDAAYPSFLTQLGKFFSSLRGDSQPLSNFWDDVLYNFELGTTEPDVLGDDCGCVAFAPEIGITAGASCLPGDPCGTNITDLGGGNWSIDGEVDATTNTMRVTVVAPAGAAFQFDNFASTPSLGGGGWVLASDSSCSAGAGIYPPVNTPLYCAVWVIANNGTPLTVSFQFFEV